MAATRLIPMHLQKGRSVGQCLKDRTDYAKNDLKTENGEFVSSYECNPDTVDLEFELTKNQYEINTGRGLKDKDVIAYQIRQSFKPGEIAPEEANRIGYETAMRWTKGKHAFIVATHVDKAHIHNHIVYNSTTLDATHKYQNFFLSSFALRRLSDLICLEHGMSVIPEKKLDLVLDIQNIIAKQKGPGYERWAKVHNVKAISKTLLYLSEHGLKDFDDLSAKATEARDRFSYISSRQKEIETRMAEIKSLRQHIFNYSKSQDVFVQYKASG